MIYRTFLSTPGWETINTPGLGEANRPVPLAVWQPIVAAHPEWPDGSFTNLRDTGQESVIPDPNVTMYEVWLHPDCAAVLIAALEADDRFFVFPGGE
jgi:hypothetical protein